MKLQHKAIFASFLLIFLFTTSSVNAQTVNWHEDIKEGEKWEWDIVKFSSTTYDISDEPVQEGDTVGVEVISDPNTAAADAAYSDVFKATINGDAAPEGFAFEIFILPISYEFYGETFQTFEDFTKDGEEYVQTEIDAGCTGEIRYQENGLLNLFEYSCDGDEVLIERKTGFFSFLPVNFVWFAIPLLLVPIIRFKTENA